MEHTPNHPLSFRFLDDEAAIQWLAENETHIQTLLSCVTRGDLEGIEAAISQAPQGILAEPWRGPSATHQKPGDYPNPSPQASRRCRRRPSFALRPAGGPLLTAPGGIPRRPRGLPPGR